MNPLYAEIRQMRAFAAHIHAPDTWLMAALKGYFDDSGDPADRNHSFFAIAGYVVEAAAWSKFETEWLAALQDFSAPYLHMKELHFCKGAFAEWDKTVPAVQERINGFLARLVGVIRDAGLRGFGAVISLKDLARFNAEKGLAIDPKALAIYGAALELRQFDQTSDIKVVLDRMSGAHQAIDLAEKYGKTDRYYPFMSNFPTFTPLARNGATGSRNTPALQAADFLAWEVRKNWELKKTWFEEFDPRPDDPKWGNSLFQWYLRDRIQHMNRHGLTSINIPATLQRRSLTELADAAGAGGCLWVYKTLCDAHETRGGVWG